MKISKLLGLGQNKKFSKVVSTFFVKIDNTDSIEENILYEVDIARYAIPMFDEFHKPAKLGRSDIDFKIALQLVLSSISINDCKIIKHEGKFDLLFSATIGKNTTLNLMSKLSKNTILKLCLDLLIEQMETVLIRNGFVGRFSRMEKDTFGQIATEHFHNYLKFLDKYQRKSNINQNIFSLN